VKKIVDVGPSLFPAKKIVNLNGICDDLEEKTGKKELSMDDRCGEYYRKK